MRTRGPEQPRRAAEPPAGSQSRPGGWGRRSMGPGSAPRLTTRGLAQAGVQLSPAWALGGVSGLVTHPREGQSSLRLQKTQVQIQTCASA